MDSSRSYQENENNKLALVSANETIGHVVKGGGKIKVKERSINAGLDFKFETVPYDDTDLHGIMSREDYIDAMTRINDIMRPGRSTKLDGFLLMTGPLMIPLAIWGLRHSRQVKRRKRLFKSAIDEFNTNRKDLFMRWNKNQLGGSVLTIERRKESNHEHVMQKKNDVPNNGNETAFTMNSENSLLGNNNIPTSDYFV